MKPLLTKKQLGKRYRKLRESIETNNLKTYTQDKLAKDLGITKTQISNLETGEKYISITELVSYAKFFNVTMEYLLGLSDNKYHNTYNIGTTLGLSDKAIERLHYYHTDNNKKDYNYIQVINFLIENLNSPKMERLDRFLFARPTHFLIKDWNKNEYKNAKYLSVCSELGNYQFTLDEINSILRLDIEKLLFELKEKAKDFKRNRIVKTIDTKELNEWANKRTEESENYKYE